MRRLSGKLFVSVFLSLLIVMVLVNLNFNNPSHDDTFGKLLNMRGMRLDPMTSQSHRNDKDFDELLALIKETNDTSECTSTQIFTTSTSCSCTAEDIFGSREAFLSYFETDEADAESIDEFRSDSN